MPNQPSKKDGGIIGHWQLHTLSMSPKEAMLKTGYEVQTDKCYVLTGTVVEDPTGRWLPGYHMRSSLICAIDLVKGIVETQNTIYKLEGESGDDVLPDMGDAVAGIYY